MSDYIGDENTFRVYLRNLDQWVEVPYEYFKEHTRYHDTFRHRMKDEGTCSCPRKQWWYCNADCLTCPYHCASRELSLDVVIASDGDTLADSVPSIKTQDDPEEMALLSVWLEHIQAEVERLIPGGDRVVALWRDDPSLSDSAIAKELCRNQTTFSAQIRNVRKKLKSSDE